MDVENVGIQLQGRQQLQPVAVIVVVKEPFELSLPLSLQERLDPVRQLADSLRSKDGLEVRNGVLEGNRVEFFRGKDFARFVKANPERCSKFFSGGALAAAPPPPGPGPRLRAAGTSVRPLASLCPA